MTPRRPAGRMRRKLGRLRWQLTLSHLIAIVVTLIASRGRDAEEIIAVLREVQA